MSARAAALAALFALAAAAAAPAAEPGFSFRPRMDWEAGALSVEVSFDLDPTTDSLPRAKWDAEMEIEARKAAFLVAGVAGVRLDSARTFAQAFATDPSLEQSIRGRLLEAPRDALYLSPDLRTLVARYTVPFFGETGVAAALAHGRATPIHRELGYTASRQFTGILISARGRLPSQGTADEAPLRPALFPRIFDQDMRLVLDRTMVSPEALVRWGMAGYTDEMEGSVATLRAGLDPLRIAARAVFGKNSADIVIPAEAARQILTVSANIDLLREGKIVIVLDSLD